MYRKTCQNKVITQSAPSGLRRSAWYVVPEPEAEEDSMGCEGRDYWEVQL